MPIFPELHKYIPAVNKLKSKAVVDHSPSTNVARVRFPDSAEFVGSLLCSERFFSGYSGFPLSSKTNI